jgi:hypothetical protein
VCTCPPLQNGACTFPPLQNSVCTFPPLQNGVYTFPPLQNGVSTFPPLQNGVLRSHRYKMVSYVSTVTKCHIFCSSVLTVFGQPCQHLHRPGSSVGIATRYGLDGPGLESRWGARFSVLIQTGPGAQPAFYTMGTGSFQGVERVGRSVDHPPPSTAEVKERVELYFYSTSGSSWPVLG